MGGPVRACRLCGARAEGFQDYCRACGAKLPRATRRWSRATVQDPAHWMLHLLITALHGLVFLGVFAIFLGEDDVLISCGVLVLLVLVIFYRIHRWGMRRRHPNRVALDVRRLLDSRVRVTLGDPRVAVVVGTRHLTGTIDGLVDFGRRREIHARIDTAIDVSDRSWEWMGLVPATEGAPLIDLLRTGSMEVGVFLVTQAYVDRVRGKIRVKRERRVQPVSLGRGQAMLPGLAR